MFALIYSALSRFFGFGGNVVHKPPANKHIQESSTFDHLLKQARTPKTARPPERATWGEAVEVLARVAGQGRFSAPPAHSRVKAARALLPTLVLQYLHVLEILGSAFPRPIAQNDEVFERRLCELALNDVHTWLAGLYSEKPVTIPAHITAVLIQRAANTLRQPQPQVMPDGKKPDFVADAEMQMHVVDKATKFCVFPRVIGRGETSPIEVTNSGRRFDRQTAALSGWEFRLGYAGQVSEPPAIRTAARQPVDSTAGPNRKAQSERSYKTT